MGLVYSLGDLAGVRNRDEGSDKTRSPRYGYVKEQVQDSIHCFTTCVKTFLK